MCAWERVSVCVCVSEKERGREREKVLEWNCRRLDVLSKSLVYREWGSRACLEGDSKETVKLPCCETNRSVVRGREERGGKKEDGKPAGQVGRKLRPVLQMNYKWAIPVAGWSKDFQEQGTRMSKTSFKCIWSFLATPNLCCVVFTSWCLVWVFWGEIKMAEFHSWISVQKG